MMGPMLTFYHTPAILDPNATGESQLTFDSNLASEPQCRFPFGTTPMLLSSDPVRSRPVQEFGHPSLILPSDPAPKFEGLFITADNFLYGPTPPTALTLSALARESIDLLVGQIGPLQEYRHDLASNARLLVRDLQKIDATEIELQGCWPEPMMGPVAPCNSSLYSNLVNVCAPSLQGPFAPTQYFHVVRDELFTLNCETRIAVRKALTAVDYLLGCVDHFVLKIFKSASSNIRLFCNVCWEKRRWFLHHGARPPKATVQAILGPFVGACSESRLAY
jgi:hypothetical protein